VRNARLYWENGFEFSCALERDLRERYEYNLGSKNKEHRLGSLIEVGR